MLIMITKFTILGERCSGTSFLQKAVAQNFDLKITWEYGWKHFFGFKSYANSDDCLFICIVRHPLDWLNSFFVDGHHLVSSLKQDRLAFITKPFFSVYDSGKNRQGRDMLEDYHIFEKRRYKDVFELRKVKTEFQLSMLKRVKNTVFIKYEDLRDDYDGVMTMLEFEFDLKRKSETFIPVTGYKGGLAPFKIKKRNTFSLGDILNKIDVEFEKSIGYDIMAEAFKEAEII